MKHIYQRRYGAALLGLVGLALLFVGLVPFAGAAQETVVDFNRDIRTILSNNCFKCHGPDENERQAGLRLDRKEAAQAELESGSIAIVPGETQESELIRRITADDTAERMPPASTGKTLTRHEITMLTDWIRQGAPFAKHWSHAKPARRLPPSVRDNTWPRNDVDRFILARLEREGLSPSAEADRYALLRRVSLDLTGLPPTLADLESSIQDTDPRAYEKFVDRLLDRNSYGEHWARMWLDLARYADSTGYADDPPRTIWAYRDWVIRAINDNMPFDQFTIEQLAGDLLPDPTEDQLIASAFHRNTLTNNEGGTNNEEFRNVAIVDRVNTTMAVWMGTTIACAQCHNHKFDPISQEEFFQLFAILNNTEDADRHDESPLFEVWFDEQKKKKALSWRKEISDLEKIVESETSQSQSDQEKSEKDLNSELQPERDRLAELKKQLSELQPYYTTVPVMRELSEDRRKTHIQHRGNYLDRGKEVTPGLPAAFPTPPTDQPINRLTLAQWLVDENNPLTARVIVNRYWEALFGVGLVRTSEEFGTQGELPSHAELLDWLATEWIRIRWDPKALLKSLVTSATYRQSSRVTPEQFQRDPDNRLLARGPRFRLSAESIHDQALFVSGLLSPKMYGPPARPPQPKLRIKAAFGSTIDWQPSEGEDRHRRGIYTTWRRSNPYPSMATFDAPNREVCTIRRARSNTPLQALVTLNDPVYVEAAQALARRIAEADGAEPDKASFGFRICLARNPSKEESRQLVELYELARQRFDDNHDSARGMATVPLGPAPEGSDVVELAAWTVVGNVLLNLDEMFLKR